MEIKTKPMQDEFNYSMLLGLDCVFVMKTVKLIPKIEDTEYNPKMVFTFKTLLHSDSSIVKILIKLYLLLSPFFHCFLSLIFT